MTVEIILRLSDERAERHCGVLVRCVASLTKYLLQPGHGTAEPEEAVPPAPGILLVAPVVDSDTTWQWSISPGGGATETKGAEESAFRHGCERDKCLSMLGIPVRLHAGQT